VRCSAAMLRNRFEEDRARIDALVGSLVDRGVIEPLADRDDDARRWSDCDLCSFVENRFHERLSPDALTAEARAAWSRRAVASDERMGDPRCSEFLAPFWILDDGARAGSIALPRTAPGHLFLQIFSLYLFPPYRAKGVAYRALRALEEAALAAGFEGIRVGTYWAWQTALRRYLLRYRMWAWHFKRSLEMVWMRELPPHAITIGAHAARFAVEHGGQTVTLLEAASDGDRLVWSELPAMWTREIGDIVSFHARATFAVALAIHGWPLLRAGDDLDAIAGSDVGGPDVLARKIAVFEYFDRENGFDVRTPRIPGLPYDAIARELAE
jgi:GNAT superfamily N-acetyltransferase